MHDAGRRGRWVFPTLLCVYVIGQIPALAGWTSSDAWRAFTRWFQALPLS